MNVNTLSATPAADLGASPEIQLGIAGISA
jgi:hypothetical protein